MDVDWSRVPDSNISKPLSLTLKYKSKYFSNGNLFFLSSKHLFCNFWQLKHPVISHDDWNYVHVVLQEIKLFIGFKQIFDWDFCLRGQGDFVLVKFGRVEVHWDWFIVVDSLFDQLNIDVVILNAEAMASILVN